MSIPLEKLYEFVRGRVPGDTLIYYFYPHGSRNLRDLVQWTDRLDHYWADSWIKEKTSTPILIHDQEPLNFSLYQNPSAQSIQQWLSHRGLLDWSAGEKNIPGLIEEYQTKNLFVPFFGRTLYDKTIVLHSEQRSRDLELYEHAGGIGAYWWAHAVIAQDWFRYARMDPKLDHYEVEDFSWHFNVYNRAWSGTREYRLRFLEHLVEHDLVSTTNTRFAEHCDGIHYRDHVYRNQDFRVEQQLEKYFDPPTADSTASAMYSARDYHDSAIDVVLETLFDDGRLHLTEKILRPIACGKPFMLVGTQGSLGYLRRYGFRTFDGLIDESYDDIEDPAQRLEAVVKEMARIFKLPDTEKCMLFFQMHQRSRYNRHWFWSPEFQDSILAELDDNIRKAQAGLKHWAQGRNWQHNRRLLEQDPVLCEQDLFAFGDFMSRRDLARVKQWARSRNG